MWKCRWLFLVLEELISFDISNKVVWNLYGGLNYLYSHPRQPPSFAALPACLVPMWSQLPRIIFLGIHVSVISVASIYGTIYPQVLFFLWEVIPTLLFRIKFKELDNFVCDSSSQCLPFVAGEAQLIEEVELLKQRRGQNPRGLFYRMQDNAIIPLLINDPPANIYPPTPKPHTFPQITHTHTHTHTHTR
jgi:hypothetical protein